MAEEKKKKTIAEKIDERVQAWIKNAESFTQGANAQFSTEGYRGNTKEYYDSVSASVAASQKEAETIRKMLQGYGSYVGDDYVKKVTKYLDDFGGYENQILAAAKQDYEQFSQYENEDAFNTALEMLKKEKEQLSFDWETALKGVDEDQAYIDAAKEFKAHSEAAKGGAYSLSLYYQTLGYDKAQAQTMVAFIDRNPLWQKMLGYLNTYGQDRLLADTTALQEDVNSRRAYANESRYAQLAPKLESEAKSAPDFGKLSVKPIDNVSQGLTDLRGMTDDQKLVWRYYAHVDPEKANEYKFAIEESVNSKLAQERFEDLENKRFLEYLFGIEAGLDQFATGLENLFSSDFYIPASSTAITSALVREDLKNAGATLPDWLGGGSVGQGAYDLLTTTSNMAPSILVGTLGNLAVPGVGAVIGASTLGTSAAGHARAEAINLGWDNGTATTYGLLVGGSEATLQYLLGGISGVSGNTVGKVLGNVDNALFRVANKIGNTAIGKWMSNMASEGFEEYLQAIIEPQIRNAVLRENNKINLIDPEALYSGILGALSAGFLESRGLVGGTVDSISAAIDTRAVGKAVIDSGMTANIKDFVYNTFSADTVAYKIADKITDKTGAYKIGKLLNSVQANLSEQNKSDIQASLIKKGVAEKDAKTITEALANVIGVKKLSEAEEALYEQGLESNDVIATVLREVIIDPNSSVNQRTSQFNTLTDDIQAANLGNIVRSAGMQGISEEDAVNLKKEAEYYGIGADEFLASAQASNATPAHFSRAFKERYLQGKIGDKTVSKYVNSYLSETEQNTAYRLGEIAAKAERESAQKSEAAMPKKKVESGTGRVTVDSSVSAASREDAKTQIQAVAKIAEALGIRVRFYESVVSENGNRVLSTNIDTAAPNGWFDKDTNTVHLDIKAGKDGKGFVMFTLAHELTHFIAKWSKTQFNVLADFVTARYNKEGKDITRTIRNRMKNLAEQNIKSYMALTTEEARYEYAREEVIADSMETMLASGNVMRDLADLRTQSEGLFNKIRGFLKQFADKIRKLYQKIAPETAEGKFIAESKDAVEELEKLFANALKVSSENYAAAGNVGVELDPTSESVSPSSVMSLRTWTASEYVQNRRQTAKILAKALDISEAKALRYIDTVNSVAKKIADDKVRLDYEASSFGSAFVSNVEYGGSFDYTTLCKKRRLYTGTFTEIQKRLKDAVLTPDEILEIRNLLIDAGYEATCGLCYVEGSRANMGKFAKEFIKLYKRDNPNSWTPTMADVNTPDGVEAMRINHPDAYDQYVYFWNHYGKLKDTDKALFASQQKPKLYEARKEYKGEILDNFKKDDSVEKKNLNGGIRMQSFSDFEIVHLIDTMQVIMDMSRVGLAGQAYTKVPEFAKAFGNTGLKINLSLIAKGVDSKGNLIFDDREGMPHETAFEIRNQYSKNVGTIIVTFTDEQLLAAMEDDRIDFIIPFHRSQWKKGQYGAMGIPKGTKDYTFMQNEKLIKQTYHEYQGRMVKDKASNYMPNEYWDFTKSGKENAESYLEMCAANNKRPKFYKLLDFDGKGKYSLKKDGSTDGYWKLLIDFKMYDNDGIGSPQMAVTPDFSMDEAMTMLDEYKGGHNTYPVAYDVVDRFVEKYESSPTPSDSAVMQARKKTISDTVDLAIQQQGNINERYNQKQISKFTEELVEYVDAATDGQIDLSQKYVAIHGPDVWHEYRSHEKQDIEVGRHQIANTATDIKEAIEAIYHPDVVEALFTKLNNVTQRQSFAYAKKSPNGHYVVVEAVGGKRNPNVVPVMILQFDEKKWNDMMAKGMVLGQLLYENDPEKLSELDVSAIKKNRVTVAQFASKKPLLNTPRSPQFKPTIPQTPSVVKTSDKNSSPSDNSMQSTRSTTDSDGNALSAEQKKFFKDSKVRDSKGNLLVCYHGTDADFSTFDPDFISSDNKLGFGFYFMAGKKLQYSYKHPKTAYLNITNPITDTSRNLTTESVRAFCDELGIDLQFDGFESDLGVYQRLCDAYEGSKEKFLKYAIKILGVDGVLSSERSTAVAFNSNQIKLTTNKTPTSDPDIRYQPRDNSYAPTFYSHMGKVVDGIKGEKIGASGVVSYLKGKGVKDEEIKWSGIEAFLEGKKSVTKAELQEFVAGSMLQIEEQMSGKDIDLRYDGSKGAYNLYDEKGNIIDTFTYNEFMDGYIADSDEEIYANELDLREALKEEYGKADAPRWADYRLKGGNNYREIVFKLPNSSYSNNAMRVHWGRDAEGVLAHARLQDMTTSDGKKMLFIEEIQSDWHNEGRGQTYEKESVLDNLYDKRHSLYAKSRELKAEISKLVDKYNTLSRAAKTEQEEKDVYARFEKETRPKQSELISTENEIKDITERLNNAFPDAPFRNTYHEYVLKRLIRMAAEQGYDSIGWTTADIQSRRWSDQYAEGYRIEYDQDIPKFLRKYGKKWGAEVGKTVVGNNVSVWSMDITDSMQDSVLYEGQAMYQPRETREYTDREILAGALDSVATSEEDRKRLTQYKKKAAEADELDRTLAELRAKKNALEEAKAKRSEIRAVQDEITKTQNRITIIDKQLFNLQATVSMKRVLESEKNRRAKQARANQKASDEEKRKKAVSDAVKKAEDDYQKKLDAQKKHQAEIEAKRKERASRTELRHKIIDKVKKLSDKLRNPSKDKHIPASLQKPVARFLSAISIDTFGADQMIKRNLKKLAALLDKLEKATNDTDRSVLMDKIEELQKSIQWEEAIGVSIKEKASTMRSAYEALANDKDPRVQDGYDQVVADMLKEVVEVCGDTPLRYMTLEQLTTLNDAINAVNKRVSESNKAFSEGKKKTIEEYAEATARELPDTPKTSVVKFVKAIKRFGWGLLKPATAMEIIGSQTFTELYENIQDGEETWMQNIAKAKAVFQEIATKHGYYSWDLQKTYDFVDTRGKTFTLTLGEMLSLYAYSRRPQAANHLEEGGFKFDEKSDDRRKKLKDRKNDKENHKLNRDILKVIENKIGETEGALEFANELQAYLSKDMAALGNEISMRMYDYLAFGEENYFPIYSSKSYIDFNPDSQGNILLKNRSFTKSVAKGANNPIIVGDFVDIWTRHVNEMITYNAFALPVEDFMRTYNFKFKTEDGSQDSIKDRIVRAYGEDAAKYVEQLLRDINGGVIADHSAEFADALVTRFKKLKVMLSASVVIQQPSAMARAFAMISPKYFRGIGVGNHKERWERVMKYAPIAMIKEMGRFDINLGQSAQDYLTTQEYSGAKEKAKAVFTDKNYRDEALTRAPAYADEMAWITIFEACEREMAELRPDLEKGSEKFMHLVGRRFTEVIRATQVYDSVFSRSQIMRSKNVFAKMITAFMSEPTTTLNMAFRSMLEASRSGKKWYALPFNRTMVAVSTSIILNSLLVSLVYAMRDDDEDETYLESYLESFTTEVADGFNPLTYIPFVKDIWSLLQGYDVERTDMALWSDIIDKAYDFIKVFNTDTSEMSEEAYDKWLKDVWSQSASAVSEILSFATGIPITNVIRDASGAVDTTVDALTSDRQNSWDTMLDAIAEGFKNTLPGSNLKPNNPAKYDPTYSDYTSYKPKDAFTQFDHGNTAKGKEIIDKLIKARMEAGDTEKEAKASLRASFTSTYKDAYNKAYLAGDNAECVRIRKLLKDSGLFPNYIDTYMSWQKEALQDKYKK